MKTTIKDIVYIASMFGALDEVVGAIENDDTLRTVDGKVVSDDLDIDIVTLDTINMLVRCSNLVLAEIAAEYIPLTRRDILTAIGGSISYDSFSQTVIDVIAAIQRGQKQKFRMRPDRIELPNGRYEIEYNYLPKKYDYEDEIDYKSAQLTARIIGYGVIAEYNIISGMQDDAVLWDGRFREALVSTNNRSEKRIRERKWR